MPGKKLVEVGDLKEGEYCLIEDEPCKILSIDISKPGKHGSSKARIEAEGVLDGQKRQIVKPTDANISVPIIDKRKAQVTSVEGDSAHLMDLETYDTFEVAVPDDLQGELEQGEEVGYWEVLDKRLLKG